MSWKIELNWTQSLWDVMSHLHWERNENVKSLKRLRFLIEIPWRSLNVSYVFKWALKILWLTDTHRCYSRLCNGIVYPLGGRYFFKKVVPSSEKQTILAKPMKILMQGSNLMMFQAFSFTKNKFPDRYKAKISEAYQTCQLSRFQQETPDY